MKQKNPSNKEIEYKWLAHSIHDYELFLEQTKKLGVKVSKSKKVRIKDVYLDTPEKFFQNAHFTCRIRQTDKHWELTVKGPSKQNHGMFSRYEKTITLPHFSSKKEAIAFCHDEIFKGVEPIFEILNNRQINTIILPDGTHSEASFDNVLMFSGNKKFRMHEIELEFKSGHLGKFKAFVKKLSSSSLIPSKSSKFEMAMIHLLNIIPSSSVEKPNDIANQILKDNFAELIKNESDVLATCSAEAVHDMRVAARRLRAAITTFKKILPGKAKKIKAELKKLGQALGKKRDLDIISECIQSLTKAKVISFPKLDRLIDKTQEQLFLALRSKFFANLMSSLEHLKALPTKQNILKIMKKQILKPLNRVLKIAPLIDSKAEDETLHRLRIAIKKLRYVCEFFDPVFSKYICSLDSFIEKTKKMQDVLGEHQDAIMGISMLMRYKSQFSSEEFILLKENYKYRKKKTRKEFFKIWKNYYPDIAD
jgi:triphosphatase